MRVSFDSNAWEVVFGSDEAKYASVRSALRSGYMEGFVCEIAFRIEAIKKQSRFDYFWSPRIEVDFPGNVVEIDGNPYVRIASIGPDDQQHPGLPNIQAERWRNARAMGVRLLRGLSWMGLPSPREVVEPVDFVTESIGAVKEREQRQIMVSTKIWNRGVGKQVFDDMGGWQTPERGEFHFKNFSKACAEWADGELVAAHIAYGNDILCTNDRARSAGQSIFSADNRSWLAAYYGVRFATVEELVELAA